MKFKTVEHSGRIHVVNKNGVESKWFMVAGDAHWVIFYPVLYNRVASLEMGLTFIAHNMDNWYTVTEAAQRLAELGKVATAPERHTMYRWLRAGRFPGAIRAGPGKGGGWRLSEKSLREFTKKRR